MKIHSSEKGQALILITFGIIALVGFTALAIDGGRAFENKRHAQNAADTAALAGALAFSRGEDIATSAQVRATSNGFDDNGTTNEVTITVTNTPSGVCPGNASGRDIKVDITTTIDTTFARVLGRNSLTSVVTATARACSSSTGAPFNGNAIVALAPTGKGFDATGTPDWTITGGGIFANSSSSNAAYCNGAAGVTTPSITVAGGTQLSCHTLSVGSTSTGASQYTGASIASILPRQPACNGTASFSGGQYNPQSGADGSMVSFPTSHGSYTFAPGLYCITQTSVTSHSSVQGSGVTFYVMNSTFSLKFNGGGNLTASAPTSGEYKGILMYLKPSFDANGNLLDANQSIDMRGNGNGNVVGTIIAPSADVTMFGNSGTGAFNSQIIAYRVDTGGTANINVSYNADDNISISNPFTLSLLE